MHHFSITQRGTYASRHAAEFLCALAMFFCIAWQTVRAQSVTISTTSDVVDGTTTSIAALNGSHGADGKISVREAILAANGEPTGSTITITIPAGTYTLTIAGSGENNAATGDLDIQAPTSGTKTVTINGAGPSSTTIQQTIADRIFDAHPVNNAGSIIVNMNGLKLTGGNLPSASGGAMLTGRPGDATNLTNCLFDGNISPGNGGAISQSSGSATHNLTITICTFSNNTAGLAGGAINYAGLGTVSITKSVFSGNKTSATGADGGAINTSGTGSGGTYTVSQCTFLNNQVLNTTSHGGAIANTNGPMTAQYNRFIGNTAATASNGNTLWQTTGTGSSFAAADNWWGRNSGPAANDLGGSPSPTAATWLQIRIAANPAAIATNATSAISADLLGRNSGGPISAGNLTGLLSFTGTYGHPVLGTISLGSVSITDGLAPTATYTAGSTSGAGSIRMAIDNDSAVTSITIQQPPSITSANNTTFTTGSMGSYTVTVTGVPTPTVSESGTLPAGVTFNTSTNVLSGTPAANSGGVFSITFTAHNSVTPDAVQTFTLTVNQHAAITSANNVTFTAGTTGSFTVTATGYPAPLLSETGALPTGISFTAGTGILGGTPLAGTGGVYPLSFKAHNSVGADSVQSFSLTIIEGPAMQIQPTAQTVCLGNTATFTASASGYPTPTVQWGLSTNNGSTWSTISSATNTTYTFTPGAGDNGKKYRAVFTNSDGTATSNSVLLTVNTTTTLTTDPSDLTVLHGGTASFTAAATGTPPPSLQWQRSADNGTTWNDISGENGTTYSFTATTPDNGNKYRAQFSNACGGNILSNVATLTVHLGPSFTSAAETSFVAASAGAFLIRTTGFPVPAITKTGALPGDFSLMDHGNGTATLSGTAPSGTGGIFPLILTAANGVPPNAIQNFTLTIIPDIRTIIATTGPHGTITPHDTVTLPFDHDTAFTITPEMGYHVDSLYINGIGQVGAPTYAFHHVTFNQTIRATFAIDSMTVTATAGPNGGIDPSGAVTLPYGARPAYTMTAAPHYHLDSIIVNGSFAGRTSPYQLDSVKISTTIRATFKIDSSIVAATAGAGGAIAPSGMIPVAYGDSAAFTITPGPAYTIDSVLVNDRYEGVAHAYTIRNVMADSAIRVVFKKIPYNKSIATGNWSSGATWSYGAPPVARDSIVVDSGTIVTLDAGSTAGAITVAGTLTFEGNDRMLTLNADSGRSGSMTISGTLNFGTQSNQRIIVPGDFLCTGTINNLSDGMEGSQLSFTGTGTHTLSSTASLKILSVNCSSLRLMLQTPATVSGAMLLTAGKLLLGNNNLTVDGTIDTGSATSYIVTDGTGRLVRMVGTALTMFPVGSDSFFHRTELATSHDSAQFRVGILQGVNPPSRNDSAALKTTFDIAKDTTINTGLTKLRMNWSRGCESPQFDRSSAVLWRYESGVWIEDGTVTARDILSSDGSGPLMLRVAIDNFTAFGHYILGNPGALPIQMTQFTGVVVAGTVHLAWTTISESNNYGYYVQRRILNDPAFTTVSELIIGAGTSLEEHHYGWIDDHAGAGKYLYRLKQIDCSGAVSYSSEIILNIALGVKEHTPLAYGMNQNYPNPFNPATKITFSLPVDAAVSLTIYNMLGQEVTKLLDREEMAAGWQDVEFDAASLPSGVYFYRLTAEGKTGNPAYGSPIPARTFTDIKKMALVR